MLSAVILTNKKPQDIQLTLNSVAFAEEIVLIRDHPSFHPLADDFAAQRNFGLVKAKGDWVLFVDDDEIVSPALAEEIKIAITNQKYAGYRLKRLDRYFGQILHHGETGGIKIIRLGKRSAGNFSRPVHEVWEIEGSVGQLRHPLIHERGELVAPFIDRMIRYSPIDAGQLTKEGKPYSFWRVVLYPKGKFILNYFAKLGFLDGYLGLFQAYLMSVQSLTVRIFQWQKT